MPGWSRCVFPLERIHALRTCTKTATGLTYSCQKAQEVSINKSRCSFDLRLLPSIQFLQEEYERYRNRQDRSLPSLSPHGKCCFSFGAWHLRCSSGQRRTTCKPCLAASLVPDRPGFVVR